VSTILFDSIVFGPVHSRRLGISLGLNLLPNDAKLCNYNCVYCECGASNLKPTNARKLFHPAAQIKSELESRLEQLLTEGKHIDSITFAGNGEPTLHPDFPEIMNFTHHLRDRYFPKTQIALLSNATRAHIPAILEAILRADNCMLKLDTGIESTYRRLNRPPDDFTLDRLMRNLSLFHGNMKIQSMFVKGIVNGEPIDNSSAEEVDAWLKKILELKPLYTVIYSIERGTAVGTLEKISQETLHAIADRLTKAGLKAEVY